METCRHNITVIAVYALSDDKNVPKKQDFFDKIEKLFSEIGDFREIIKLDDLNGKSGRYVK